MTRPNCLAAAALLLAAGTLLLTPAAAQRSGLRPAAPAPRPVSRRDAAAAREPLRIPPLYARYVPVAGSETPTDSSGLRFTLAELRSNPPAAHAGSGAGRLLSQAEAARLLGRLQPLDPVVTPADSFAFPAQTLPPPRTGRMLLASFPPRDSLAATGRPLVAAPNGLEVVRRAPEGELEPGVEITVTFSQPMVPLTSVGEAATLGVPVRLTPQPAGRWRWIDTRTVKFEPAGRLPAATRYSVEVPAGTRSASGAVLQAPERWSFATGAAHAIGATPQPGPTGLTPVLVLAFDQRIDPAAVLRSTRLTAAGSVRALRLATAAELAADADLKRTAESQLPGTWLAFRPVDALPADAPVRVAVGPGTPSAEGPRRSEVEQYWEFRTRGALRLTESHCGCRPLEAFQLFFSNPLEAASLREGMVRVTPALPRMEVVVLGNALVVRGESQASTRYSVEVAAGLRDVFGQTLAAPVSRSFSVGLPWAMLAGPGRMVVLDPLAEPALSLVSLTHTRLRLRLARVTPADWWAAGALSRGRDGAAAVLPGTTVVDRELRLPATPGESRELRVDLAPALRDGVGQVLVAVEALDGGTPEERGQAVYTWVQSTRLGLSAFSDDSTLLAWATSLVDGAPAAGAEVWLQSPGPKLARGVAGADGTASLALGDSGRVLLVAQRGADLAILAPDVGAYANWRRRGGGDEAAWYLFSDRNLYRPGETVHFKGWLRRMHRGQPGALQAPRADSVRWVADDPRGNELAHGVAHLTPLGGFDASFSIPAGANLGQAEVTMDLMGDDDDLEEDSPSLTYRIDEFRRPEYTVAVETAGEGPWIVGGIAEVSAHASYFAGGALAAAPVHWQVTATPGYYAPPGWDEWQFGDQGGWWSYGGRGQTRTSSLDGFTSAQGEHTLRIAFDAADPPRPYQLTAQATVTDVNRQTWSADAGLLVHPAAVYVGLRTARAWLTAGDSIDAELVVVDLDGKVVEGRSVEASAVRHGWTQVAGQWREVTQDSVPCLRVSAAQPVRCVVPHVEGGSWTLSASTRDAQGRFTRSRKTIWVMGGRVAAGPPSDDERSVELVPDRAHYAVGDTARILLRTRFSPSRGLITLRRGGLAGTQEIRLDGPVASFKVPIGEQDVPGLEVQVDLVGAADGRGGEAARGVTFATGSVTLDVPPLTRTLTVRALPRDTAGAPDSETALGVEVRDAAGRPVANAEVALVVADEAVLALSGYHLPDPLSVFYPARQSLVQEVQLRSLVQVVAPDFEPAQGTLVGRTVDARNGEPLGGVRLSLDGGTAVSSDAAGRFRLGGASPGEHRLVAEMEGYAPVHITVPVGRSAPAPLRLSLVPLALAELVEQGRSFDAVRGNAPLALNAIVVNSAAMARRSPEGLPPPPPPPPPAPGAAGQGAAPGIAVRSNFDPLALFAPVVRTDAEGRASVPFRLPSNLTRYRATAVAVEGGTRFGIGEAGLTVRQPLMVRPSAPRFLNWGDRFELPVVVQNQTGQPLEVDVAARGSGVSITETGRHVTVPAHDRVEVRLAAEAQRSGPAQLQVVAASPALSDAAEVRLPVYTPATAEAFATYGTFSGDSAHTLPLRVPADALPGFGGLEVSTSSTAMQELTDAVIYLVSYPYECSEQLASRMLAVAALRDVLSAFRSEALPAPERLSAAMDADIAALVSRQNGDGGFGLWKQGDPSFPYASLHAIHALQRAREKGYRVPDAALARAQSYLRAVPGNLPREYPGDVRRALHAYALYVRARLGDASSGEAVRRFIADTPADSVTLEEAGWLLSASAGNASLQPQRSELLRRINNRATETSSTATFATHYTEGEYLLLHSQRRSDGVVLEALLATQPQNPLIPKVVRGLLGNRVRGRWDNTQENAWVLLALDRYFHAFEGETPEFVARLWLGERFAGSHDFSGRQTDRWQLDVPMQALQQTHPDALTIAKQGPGRLYYRAGLRYAPRDLDLLPLDAGFRVSRSYAAVDDPADVRLGADGRWQVKAGARVRVTLTMTAPSRRLHVALADPLPAGFEPVNPELQGAQQVPPAAASGSAEYGWWWRRYWYQHQNLRDQRAEAFTALLRAGTYTWSYVARATTPGQYIVPPAHAEEMYSPETFGRGKTDRVLVEPQDQC